MVLGEKHGTNYLPYTHQKSVHRLILADAMNALKRIETENIFAQENRYSNSYTREDHF